MISVYLAPRSAYLGVLNYPLTLNLLPMCGLMHWSIISLPAATVLILFQIIGRPIIVIGKDILSPPHAVYWPIMLKKHSIYPCPNII